MAPSSVGFSIVFATLAAGVGAVYLLQYLYRQRGQSGADWFMGNIAAVAGFCLAYGIGLLVFDEPLRIALEVISFIGVCFMGPFFLAFGLAYTGRRDLIRSPLFAIVAIVPLVSVGLAVTNPWHGLVWTDFQLDPVFGLATATYTFEPWAIFAFAFSIGTAAVGSLLLIGAILSYGPLYRREATAVILSTAPPSVGVALWLFGVGPLPELHLTGPLMLIHIALDGYAFVGTHMFETNPATQRMAERTGLDSLSDPVLILDSEDQVVRTNDRAEKLFMSPDRSRLPIDVATFVGVELEDLRNTGELTIDNGGERTFAVSYTELTDPGGNSVGSMLVLYDVTEDRQREQHIAVLNRVLRHNLRNETTVIRGYANILEGVVDDPKHATQAQTIAEASDRLNSIAEKVRNFEELQNRPVQPETVDPETLIADVVRPYTQEYSDAEIRWTVQTADLEVTTDPAVLSMLLENLLENALIHAESTATTVDLSADRVEGPNGDVRFEIRDENERIPEYELETLRAGEETALQHGQGIGLWISYWCIQKLNGDLEFAYEEGNVVSVIV